MKILILSMVFMIVCACNTMNIDTLPMMDGSIVKYITVSSYGITGFKGMIIDRFQYDPKTNKEVLIKSDAFGAGSQPFKLPDMPFIP